MDTADSRVESLATGSAEMTVIVPEGAPQRRKRNETLYFAFRNKKLVIGLTVVLAFLVLAIVGPWLTDADPFEFGFPTGQPPSREYLLGTTGAGQDVYPQFVYGLRASFVVGAVAGVVASIIAMTIGFIGGYRGGVIDEILSMLTNVVLVIPTLAVLIVIAAYLSVGSLLAEAILIGITSWPWAARAIRAQTFTLASRDFVSLARLSGRGSAKVILKEIAPNMSSYLFLVFILLFGGSILAAATLDFLGLGPSQVMSLGLMLNNAVSASALQLGYWWWFIPPGIGITAIVGGLYVMNVGLDEVFNPKLRDDVSLAVDNLRVYYRTLRGDVSALDGVTFAVADGEIMGLAGESGCGKTTLGKSLVRLDGRMRLVEGAAWLNDAELPIGDERAMDAFRYREVSIIPQYAMSALNPIRKIGRMISELLESRGASYDATLPELSRRLGLVGLDDEVLGRFPIELSGGQKQRV